jgi:hypothetical protein
MDTPTYTVSCQFSSPKPDLMSSWWYINFPVGNLDFLSIIAMMRTRRPPPQKKSLCICMQFSLYVTTAAKYTNTIFILFTVVHPACNAMHLLLVVIQYIRSSCKHPLPYICYSVSRVLSWPYFSDIGHILFLRILYHILYHGQKSDIISYPISRLKKV